MSAPKKQKTEKQESKEGGDSWSIRMSDQAASTFNPIRAIVDTIVVPKGTPAKPLIPLSIGDPTLFGNLKYPDTVNKIISKLLESGKYNGYPPSVGYPEARAAIAERYSPKDHPLTAEDVCITSGCSGALAIAIPVLANSGDNILTPRPGFSLYQTIALNSGIKVKNYDLKPDCDWEIDLAHMESQIDDRTKAILILNPSNPTGSNYSKEHVLDILAVAEKHKLPIIADEIYGEMVFGGKPFYSLASLSTNVPVLAVGGIAKQLLVPGWRVGWLLLNDRGDKLRELRKGVSNLSQIILGANSLIQAALPEIFKSVTSEYYSSLCKDLERHANIIVDGLSKISGLRVIAPKGAMYLMVQLQIEKFKDILDDRDFAQKLLTEELVYVLPAAIFGAPNFVRLVICAPDEMLKSACTRIGDFCARHQLAK